MKLKLIPALVTFVFGLAMFGIAKLLPFGQFTFFGQQYLMYGLVCLAICIALAALLLFKNAKTTISPVALQNTTTLVTTGIYGYTRNPMYLALLLVLLAWGLYLGNAFNILLAAGFVYYMNAYQIIPEEQMLISKFGKAYRIYLKGVRRWF
ncbi:isoprenylcysteine carboxylmethyltransferase family protein [Flavobacterium sp. ASW18X]|uniref:methyltransferase family protein n=1 Tax=Flavobacterium sp. ASW18X TaxID=2572595 RepID=UPI0010AE1058|nr:isoprenylcysteine carboxylmethyltransferase family protein [Flavobacterium sp. ASW18X]TKD60718.1 isoprenylcysteine carboxylmethyltransferase family protein [Flavobacterium sp. ASW18X]